jgi:DNA-binding CsgD family transcriptional regulator
MDAVTHPEAFSDVPGTSHAPLAVMIAVTEWIDREAIARIIDSRLRHRGMILDIVTGATLPSALSGKKGLIVWQGGSVESCHMPHPLPGWKLISLDESVSIRDVPCFARVADWRANPQALLQQVERAVEQLTGADGGIAGRSPQRRLTPRQQAVLALLAEGHPNGQIATMLGMSENTVRIHVSAIFRALGVRNRTQAALRGRQAA